MRRALILRPLAAAAMLAFMAMVGGVAFLDAVIFGLAVAAIAAIIDVRRESQLRRK